MKKIEMTYGDMAHAAQIYAFLRWMYENKVTVPKAKVDSQSIAIKYAIANRDAQYQALLKKLDKKVKHDSKRPVSNARKLKGRHHGIS